MDENNDAEVDEVMISPIDVAVMWAKSKGISCPNEVNPGCIDLVFDSQGFSYSATLGETEENTLTIAIAYELPDQGKELELRRHMDKVDLATHHGALIYDHERQMVVWRESMSSYDELPLEPEDITRLIQLGVRVFDVLREELAEFLGLSPADALLAKTHAQGRA